MNEEYEFTPNSVKSKIVGIEVDGFDEPDSLQAAQLALDKIGERLTPEQLNKLTGIKISVGDDLTDSGGRADAENNRVVLDKAKNQLSISEAEALLVGQAILNPGDWTATMPDRVDSKWSTLTYQLIHELGHIVDGRSVGDKYNRLDPSLSPTKYGSGDASEAFAEAFAHHVLGTPINEDAARIIGETIASEIDIQSPEIKK